MLTQVVICHQDKILRRSVPLNESVVFIIENS